MKKFAMLTIALLMTTVSVFGAEVPEVSFMSIPAEKKFSMTIDDLKEPAKVVLKDVEGIILLEEETDKKGNYTKIYDLKNLPNGTYYMSVKTSIKETVQPIELTDRGVEVDADKRKSFFSPVIRSAENYVDISLYNGRISDITVSIFDSSQKMVFKESLENVLLVQKRYSTKKLKWGRYTMIVDTPNDVYSHDFQVR